MGLVLLFNFQGCVFFIHSFQSILHIHIIINLHFLADLLLILLRPNMRHKIRDSIFRVAEGSLLFH